MNDLESVVTGWKVYYSGMVRNGSSCVKYYCYYIGYLKLLRDLGELFVNQRQQLNYNLMLFITNLHSAFLGERRILKISYYLEKY